MTDPIAPPDQPAPRRAFQPRQAPPRPSTVGLQDTKAMVVTLFLGPRGVATLLQHGTEWVPTLGLRVGTDAFQDPRTRPEGVEPVEMLERVGQELRTRFGGTLHSVMADELCWTLSGQDAVPVAAGMEDAAGALTRTLGSHEPRTQRRQQLVLWLEAAEIALRPGARPAALIAVLEEYRARMGVLQTAMGGDPHWIEQIREATE